MRLNQALITGTILTGAGVYKTWKDYKTAPQEQKKRVLIRNTAALGTAALAVFSVDRFMNKKFSSDVLQNFSHRVSSAILNNKFVKKITGKLLPSKELQPVKFAAISDIIANCTNDVMLTASAALAGVTAGFIADKALYPAKNAKSNAVDTNKTQTTQTAEPTQPQQTQPKKNNALIEKLTNEKAQNLFLDTASIFESAGFIQNPLGKTSLVLSSIDTAKEKNFQTLVEQTASGIVAEALIPTLFVSLANTITTNKSFWIKIPAIAAAFYSGNFIGEHAGRHLTHEIRDEFFEVEDENEENEEAEETEDN